jgi:ParB/Sulfiredoxin domain
VSKLVISPENARKTFTNTGIEEMQASILAHGLMQNLVVTEAEKENTMLLPARDGTAKGWQTTQRPYSTLPTRQ